MSCDGTMIGAPFAGDRTLFVDIIKTRFQLCLKAQWNVNRHLVTVKVRVKRRTDKRVKLIAFPSISTGSNA